MKSEPRVLAFAGSLRDGSFNKKLVRVAAAAAREAGATVTEIDLADHPLPIYDGDLESASGLPENARTLKRLFAEHDALLISAPEYNGSITAVLKNTIDWVSRAEPDEPSLVAYSGKVAALLAASPGGLGGLRGLVHVRAVLTNLRVLVLPEQVAVGQAFSSFDEDGALTDDAVAKRVNAVASRLVEVVRRLDT